MLKEFRDFISKGNVLDLAVGIIIGVAFTAIVASLVDDLIAPIIGLIIGGLDLSGLKFLIGDASFNYGNFIQAIIKFLIVAFVVFMIVKAFNSMRKKEEAAPAAPAGPTEVQLLMEIRDALKAR